MKKFFKVIGVIVLVFMGLVVIGAMVSNHNSSSSTPATTDSTSTPAAPTTTQPAAPQSSGKITKADYDSFVVGDTLTGKGGTSYDSIVAKFGEPDSKSETEANGTKMIMADWSAEGDLGANVALSFMDGSLDSKSQTGLK